MKHKSTQGVFGVHPVLAAIAGIVLVLFGALLGAWFDRDAPQPGAGRSSQRTFADHEPASGGSAAGAPRPAAKPPAFLSIPSDSYERPDPVGPRAPEERPVQSIEKRMPSSVSTPAPSVARRPAADYALRGPFDPAVPGIAIVIDDMGLDRVRSQRMTELPGPLTLSFLTYAAGLPAWSEAARAAGHEILAHVPMEPLDPREDPGPGALTMSLTAEQIAAKLNGMLSPWQGYVGVNNHMGSRMTADRWRMDLVMKDLKSRGLLWLDSKTAPDTVAIEAAAAAGVPHAARDFFLDNVATVDAISLQLQAVEDHARRQGSAVAIGHPYDSTLIALETWITDLPRKGLTLVPISEVARRRGHGFATAGNATP